MTAGESLGALLAVVRPLVSEAAASRPPEPGTFWSCRVYSDPVAVDAVLIDQSGREQRIYRARDGGAAAGALQDALNHALAAMPPVMRTQVGELLSTRQARPMLVVEPDTGRAHLVLERRDGGDPILVATLDAPEVMH